MSDERDKPEQVIYLLKMFPRFSETFILNEILGMENLGVRVRIFSLKMPNDGKFHSELGQVKARAQYIPEYILYNIPSVATSVVRVLRREPRAVISTFVESVAAMNLYAVKRWMQAVWLADKLKDEPSTGVHCHFALSAPRVAYFLHKINGNPYTFTAHAKDIFLKSTNAWLMRRKIACSAGVITVSDYNRKYLVERFARGYEGKIERIYNGIDLATFAVAPFEGRAKNTILSVSRLVEKKGLSILLRACGILRDAGVEFECRICGEGPLAVKLEEESRRLGLETRVRFLGPLPQSAVRTELKQCTMLVAPSVEAKDGNLDALPTILLEALATGTPAVSTTVTGIPEIIADGEEGLLVPPGDASALAGAIRELLSQPELRRRFGANGRAKAERFFDRENSVRSLAAFFARAHRARPQLLRVGYVLTMFPRLSETFILREIAELEELGADITVFSQKRPADSIRHAQASAIRAKIVYLGPWWRTAPAMLLSHIRLLLLNREKYVSLLRFVMTRSNLPAAKKLWRAGRVADVARREKIELLHAHFISGNTRIASFASQLSGVPYSATAHAKDIYAAGMSDSKLARHVDGAAFVATISEHNREYLAARAPSAHIKVLPNAVNTREFSFRRRGPIAGRPLRLLAIGRLVEKKGFHVMLRALGMLREQGFLVEARIVGEGPEQERLEQEINTQGVQQIVQMTGPRSQEQVREDIDWADALVVPSIVAKGGDVDGMPVVILEAMASGLPVVASRISGIPEVVRDNETGVLVEPGNAEQLATAIRSLADRDLSAMGSRGLEVVAEQYDLSRNCRRLFTAMTTVTARNRAAQTKAVVT